MSGWLSTAEVAKRLGLTQRTVYRLINDGELVAYKFGRVIRSKSADVEDFVERSRLAPGSLSHLLPDGADWRSEDEGG